MIFRKKNQEKGYEGAIMTERGRRLGLFMPIANIFFLMKLLIPTYTDNILFHIGFAISVVGMIIFYVIPIFKTGFLGLNRKDEPQKTPIGTTCKCDCHYYAEMNCKRCLCEKIQLAIQNSKNVSERNDS